MISKLFISLPFSLLLLVTPLVAYAETLTVFAAASLKTAMDEIGEAFENETGHHPAIALAGSSTLARQIEQGAPADVFISANIAWMDELEENGHIRASSRVDLLGNRIVLIARRDDGKALTITANMDLKGRLGNGHLAMALVDAVPAGIYGKQALESLGIWDDIAPRVAQADNVRAALALVATGAAPLGIVYASDARAEDRVKTLDTFPADSHAPIIYSAAATARGNAALADQFLTYLKQPAARAVFQAQGFEVLTK